MAHFDELGLPERLVARLQVKGLTEPTPIQTRAIPHALNGQDVMGLAQTGTGKTLAFGLPLIARLSEYGTKPAPKTVRALVLAPTRELANQIAASLKDLVEGTPFKVGLVVGGVAINPQIKRVGRGTDVIIATPGRLIDLMERNALEFEDTDFLVLDEADQMLDLGFIHALRRISEVLPSERQTMLFSATMPKQMNEIAQTYLQNPIRIQVAPPGQAADKIEQSIHFIAKAEKGNLLKELLEAHREEASIVFTRTKHGAERLMKSLEAAGFPAESVHGNKSQGQRERAIRAFREGEAMVLVATDVAARGLDIPHVRHVYNFDLPNVPDNYVHRIGRTARAGMDGAAIAFCAPDEVDELKAIQKTMKYTIPVASGRPWMGLEDSDRKGKGKGKGGARRGGGKPRGKSVVSGTSSSDFAADLDVAVYDKPKEKPFRKPRDENRGEKRDSWAKPAGDRKRDPRRDGDSRDQKSRDRDGARFGGKPDRGPRKSEGRFGDKPVRKSDERRGDKPGGKSGGKPDGRRGDRPEGKIDGRRGDKPGAKPEGRRGDKPAGKPEGRRGDRPGGGKPEGRRGDKPGGFRGDRPGGKPDGRRGDRPGGGKPEGRRGDKPSGKPDRKADGKNRSRDGGKPKAHRGQGGNAFPRRRSS